MDRVKGKVAIVTGGASGLGKAAAELMAQEGAVVAVTDVSDEAGQQTVAGMTARGATAGYWHMDVTNEEQVAAVFNKINETYGKIDILFNNAGIPGTMTPTHELPSEEWHRVINVDLNGTVPSTSFPI